MKVTKTTTNGITLMMHGRYYVGHVCRIRGEWIAKGPDGARVIGLRSTWREAVKLLETEVHPVQGN